VVKKNKSTFPITSYTTCIAVNNSTNARCHRPRNFSAPKCTKRFLYRVLRRTLPGVSPSSVRQGIERNPVFIDDKHCVYHHEDILKTSTILQRSAPGKRISAPSHLTIVFLKPIPFKTLPHTHVLSLAYRYFKLASTYSAAFVKL
jgi:hypothetical protein